MKKITLIFMLLVSFSGFAQFPAPYCGPMTFTSNVEPITSVNFAGINNSSSSLVGANNGTTIIAHENYTAIVGNVTAGSSYPIILKGNTDGDFENKFRVYIDWNQNNIFTDGGESYDIGNIVNSSGVDAVQLVGNIAVPGTALGGNTRMRVIKRYNAFGTSCQTGVGYGQAEDYTLSVTAILPCLTGTNYPDVTTIPAICDGFTPNEIASDSYAGDYFYVSVTSGQTYKFISSVNTDFLTLSIDDGATAIISGTTPLTWVSNFTGNVRVHLNTNSSCGTEDVDRTTSVVCGVPCLTGTLYPSETYTVPICDGTTVNVVATDSYAGEYSNINVFAANDYIISSSNATDYITIASADGLTVLAIGTGSINFSPASDGEVRVYFHTNSTCGAQTTNREKRIVCSTALTVPQCASNPTPANGSITVPAFTTFDLSWDAPTSGEPATSYDFYDGTDPENLVFDGNFTATTIPAVGPINAYSTTIYWKIIPRNAAGTAIGCVIWSYTTEPQPTDTPDYVNLQSPPTITITQSGSGTVYGQVYEPGLTDVTSGQAPGILAWVGVSPVGVNSDPATWTNWTPATFNIEVGNNDEYQAIIGAALAPGTYYYATRFTLNGGPYVYGGLNNGFWDASAHPSGVLTVNPPPPPANDDCSGAIALTPGGVFADNVVTGTMLGATLTSGVIPSCQNTNIADVWYTVVVPASGNLTIETQVSATSSLTDTVIAVYTATGICGGTLAQIGCDDDSGLAGPNNLMAILSLTGQTPGSTLYIGVWKYGTIVPSGSSKDFLISAYDGSLSNSSFDNPDFTYYPNPVKNILNLSYNQEISSVEIYNLLGQKVSSNTFNANNVQIDMSILSKGAYMVKVTSNNQLKTIKVIKE